MDEQNLHFGYSSIIKRNAVGESTIGRWCVKFKAEDVSLEDANCSGKTSRVNGFIKTKSNVHELLVKLSYDV